MIFVFGRADSLASSSRKVQTLSISQHASIERAFIRAGLLIVTRRTCGSGMSSKTCLVEGREISEFILVCEQCRDFTQAVHF